MNGNGSCGLPIGKYSGRLAVPLPYGGEHSLSVEATPCKILGSIFFNPAVSAAKSTISE
jgi:hypothetical protein